MANWLSRREPDELPLISGRPRPSAAVVRQVNREIERVQGAALVQNARLGALGYIGDNVQVLIESQQRSVDAVGERVPRAEAGCQAVAHMVTAASLRIVQETGQ